MKGCMGPGLGTRTIHVVTVHGATYLDSAIIADACNSNWDWWSELYALAYATLSSTSAPDKPYLVNRVTIIVIGSSNSKWPLHHFLCISLDEQWSITSRIYTFQLLQEVSLAGKCPQNQYTSIFLLHHHCQLATVRNSARVKYINLELYLLHCMCTWQVTAKVWQSCVFPVRNSPKISVMDPVSIPPSQEGRTLRFTTFSLSPWHSSNIPPSSLSSSFDPVVSWMISDRRWWNSVAVVNPMGTSFAASPCILSALASLIPLIARRAFLGA